MSTGISAICAAASFAFQIWAGAELPGWGARLLLAGGSCAAALSLVLPIRRAEKALQVSADAQQIAENAVFAYRLALQDVLLPLTDLFDRVLAAKDHAERVEAEGAAKQAIVGYIATLAGVPRARACYFDYETGANPGNRLSRRNYTGRRDRPRDFFSSEDDSHRRVFELLEARRSEFQPDLTRDCPSGVPAYRHYQTYISVPVATSKRIFGLLTLDARTPGELTREHEMEVRLLAQMLALMLGSSVLDRPEGNSDGRVSNDKWVEYERHEVREMKD